MTSTLAGVFASTAESLITYPLESAKVKLQLGGRPWQSPVYAGASIFCIGNGFKAFVRFNTFNYTTNLLADNDSEPGVSNVILAGILTGIAETPIVVVTENIKTRMIASPRYGLPATLFNMWKQGFRSFGQGLSITWIRQIANSGLRFTSYNFSRQIALSFYDEPDELSFPIITAMAGGTALTETMFTQPLDTIKSRMQAGPRTKGSPTFITIGYNIVKNESWLNLWAGSLPRWGRVWLSGAITWGGYEAAIKNIGQQMHQRPFQ